MARTLRLRTLRGARAALARRHDVRAAEAVARARAAAVRLVGGAVRDAFLGRGGGDLDLAAAGAEAAPFAEALAARLGVRVVAMGRPGTRVFRIPSPPGEVDVWEVTGSPEEDRDRRDFTINALSFALPGWAFDAPGGALDDLAEGRLKLPRPGVLLEDPLRVLRAARLAAELPGFCVAPSALAELRRAARRLGEVASERILAELDRILATPPGRAARALSDLESWGAFAALLPGASPAARRAGIARVARLPRGTDPGAARVALVLPLGRGALAALEAWKAPKREMRLAERLLGLAPAHRAARTDAVRAARALAPFVREAAAVLRSSSAARERALGARLARLSPAALERVLRPPRFLLAEEAAALLGVAPGPALGRALAALDEAAALGRVRSAAGARRFLCGR